MKFFFVEVQVLSCAPFLYRYLLDNGYFPSKIGDFNLRSMDIEEDDLMCGFILDYEYNKKIISVFLFNFCLADAKQMNLDITTSKEARENVLNYLESVRLNDGSQDKFWKIDKDFDIFWTIDDKEFSAIKITYKLNDIYNYPDINNEVVKYFIKNYKLDL